MRKIEDDDLLTFEELAELKRWTVSWIKKAKREYALPHYKLGRMVRFKKREIDQWIEERHQAG